MEDAELRIGLQNALTNKKSKNSIYKKWRKRFLLDMTFSAFMGCIFIFYIQSAAKVEAWQLDEQPEYTMTVFAIATVILFMFCKWKLQRAEWSDKRESLNEVAKRYRLLGSVLTSKNQQTMFLAVNDYIYNPRVYLEDSDLVDHPSLEDIITLFRKDLREEMADFLQVHT